jgi:tRNA/rRNA methyltransferase
MGLEQCRVVLVRPHIAANLGATARVMRNLGLGDLAIVEPLCDPLDPRARQLAARAEDVLTQAKVFPDFGAAVADCILVAGTSARTGGLFRRQSLATPDEIMPSVIDALERGPAALVFGPEPSGLTNEEVSRCHGLIHIPTDSAYPALNLAQAVAICVYELRRSWLQRSTPVKTAGPVATFAQQEQMFTRLRTALEEIHFLYGPKADSLMHALRHLLGRDGLTPMEVDVLNGLARQIRWYVANASSERGASAP